METTHVKFNAGIWSEVLKGRYDLGNYQSASRTCDNFIPTRYGQVEKRSGTKHLGYAKYDDKVCVLHAFQFSVTTKFMLEFGEYYVRFWSNDLQVETAPNTPLEVVTPYAEADLYELQIRAVNDIVYIVHPDYPVGSLTRLADDNWTYQQTALDLPFVDPEVNTTDIRLTPSAATGSITITASGNVFDSTYVGSELRLEYISESVSKSFHDNYIISASTYDSSLTIYDDSTPFAPLTGDYETDSSNSKYWKVHRNAPFSNQVLYYTCIKDYKPTAWTTATSYALDDVVTESSVAYYCVEAHTSGTFATDLADGKWVAGSHPADFPNHFSIGNVTMQPVTVTGEWNLKTTGNWRGDWWIQRSVDNGFTWSTIKVLSSRDDSNYLVEEDEQGVEVQIRVLGVTSYWNSREYETVTFTTLAAPIYGKAEVTAYNSPTSVNATVTSDMPKLEPSVNWQEAGFSPRQGYPRTIALFDNRLLLAGTKKKPQAFFYSGINEYENFLGGTLADSPFYVETLSDDQSAVQWLSAQRELFVGTASVEGILLTRKQDEAQSAENLPVVRWNESMGSAHRAALPMRDSLMCLQRGRTTINMLSYSLERDGYQGEEVSLLCPHLFQSGVQQMAHMREPYTGALTVNEDGTMCHLIYEPKLQVTGWCKFTTKNGSFESVQVLPSTTDEDEVWCSVKRTINGVTCRHIERFTTSNRSKQRADDIDNVWYVDAGVKVTGSGLTTVTGLDHLEGETICALCDGIKGEYTVSGGSITLPKPADTIIAGIPVESEFEPLDVDYMPSNRSEGTLGKRKQLYQSKLMLYKSLGGSIASDGEDYQDLIYHTSGETMDESLPLKDGYMEVFHESSHSRQKWWRIKHDEPYPFTLQAVMQSFTVSKK